MRGKGRLRHQNNGAQVVPLLEILVRLGCFRQLELADLGDADPAAAQLAQSRLHSRKV